MNASLVPQLVPPSVSLSTTDPRDGHARLRRADSDHVLYLISRFASEANRRLIRVLSLKTDGLSPVVVQERHPRRLDGVEHVTIPRGLRPGHGCKLLGLRRLGDAIDRQLYFPSTAVQFARRASRALSSRIARDLQAGRRVTVVTFVPPHDVLQAGRRLKQRFPGIRWVVDCQIVWALDEHHQQSGRARFVARMKEFEGSCLRAADRIAVESAGVKEELQRLYRIPQERIHAIENAYDDTDIGAAALAGAASAAPGRPGRPLRLGFLGNCFKPPKVPGDRLLMALDSVVAKGFPLRLKIVGDAYLEQNPDHVRPYPWVERHPRCSHSDALAALADSDALLLFLARTPWTRVLMHAKLPYYLASGIPVIAIVPNDSNTASIFRRTGSGVVLDCDLDWGEQLYGLLSNWEVERQRIQPRPHEIARFSWSAKSREWLNCLCGE